MTAARHDLTIEAGATFRRQLAWKDSAGELIDTSGYTARMSIRSATNKATLLQELTNANGGITLGGGTYNIVLTITATDTSALNTGYTDVKAVYDLELSGGGVVTRVLQGEVRITPEMSK